MAIDDNTSYELTGYQVKDLAQKIRAKADASSLASVATSGLYSDLIGTPTIPTVYNGKLTIKQNGATIDEFTANQSSDTTISLTDTTYSDFTGATSSVAGVAGLVPAPAAGDDTKFLSGNGLWTTVSQYSLPIASSSTLGGIKVGSNLSIDSGTGVLSATDTTYTAGTNVQISAGNVISATDTTYSDFTGATTQQAGAAGLVPAPTTSDPEKYLKGDGTWDTPTDTTYSAGTNVQISAGNVISATDTTYSDFTGATSGTAGAHGLVPAPAAGDQNKVLSGAGTWVAQSGGSSYTAGDHIDITNDVISAVDYVSADSPTAAVSPSSPVTTPMIADGAVTSAKIATGAVPIITMTDTDPGEGSPLAANNFVAVYGEDPSNMNYSLTEAKTGATWIDGSPIYKKTINTGALPNATSKNIAHGISNLSKVLKMDGYTYNPTPGNFQFLPMVAASVADQVTVVVNNTNIVLACGNDRSAYSESYVTLYYIKSS